MSNKGKKLSVHYRGTLEDGTQFDSSYDRDEPLSFVCGAGQMISGFDKAVEDMQINEKKRVILQPHEAYGERNEALVFSFDRSLVPGAEKLQLGDHVQLSTAQGMPIPAQVTELSDTTIQVDANHELAGKNLIFDIELMGVEDAQ
ncbi:FKBP-type peptidyl-prolyl cis-trans isomerase [Atopobium deltae]|uniref:Peptidyl-prolyl cis-trans isomerase n=1 Tax=Atopobium deltae TaxID=1393034 RepID=A0A133XVY0_9ACTN|nr:peptidylprolyl isomerase [Atopobium deltae]KXB35063.1 putative FKBP-type peptidyl-prolyl cis-trans isomerase [Atopobium deltae]